MRTDEEGAGKGPFLGSADDGEREPVGGDEGMQQRHSRNPPDRRQIRSTKTLHLHFLLLFLFFPFIFFKKLLKKNLRDQITHGRARNQIRSSEDEGRVWSVNEKYENY